MALLGTLVNFRVVGGTGMGPMVGCLVVFQAERVVFIREHSTGSYSTLAYYLAKVMADLPFLTIVPVVQGTISYFMVHSKNYSVQCISF